MKDTGRASSLFPAARDRGCSAFQLWPAGLLGWLERRREARVCLLTAKGAGLWELGLHGSKED